MNRDPGENIDAGQARLGGTDWIDLSGVSNRRPWVGDNHARVESDLAEIAARWFRCDARNVLPIASDGLSAILRFAGPGSAAVVAPNDDGHTASLSGAGYTVREVNDIADMQGADLALLSNPNNPDGCEWPPAELRALAATVRYLVIDETHADARLDLSLASDIPNNALILRSFATFWGRPKSSLSFVIADPDLLLNLSRFTKEPDQAMRGMAARVMSDHVWADETVLYLAEAGLRLDRLAIRVGWKPVGGTHLFRLYDTPNAAAAQDHLTQQRVLARRFPFCDRWLRLAIPANRDEWARVTRALKF